jgi:hypothetical protein
MPVIAYSRWSPSTRQVLAGISLTGYRRQTVRNVDSPVGYLGVPTRRLKRVKLYVSIVALATCFCSIHPTCGQSGIRFPSHGGRISLPEDGQSDGRRVPLCVAFATQTGLNTPCLNPAKVPPPCHLGTGSDACLVRSQQKGHGQNDHQKIVATPA